MHYSNSKALHGPVIGTSPIKVLHVVVLTPLGPGGKGGIDRLIDQLRIAFDAHPNVTCYFATTRGPGHLALSPAYLAMAIARIVILKMVGRIDICHVNLSDKGSTYRKLIAAWALRFLRIPYVLHLHGAAYHRFWDTSPSWIDRAIRNLFSRSARIIVLGSVWAELIRRKVPTVADRVVILPTSSPIPVNLDKQRPIAPVKIIFLGRLGARKGVPQLVAALGQLGHEIDWRATLTGDGEVMETRAAVDRLGLSNHISVLGWVPDSEIEALLRVADILVLPSFDEGLPLSVVEAFAHGIAVICTPVGALPDILENERTGLLVEPGDVAGLTAAIRRLLGDPVLRRRLGANAQAFHAMRLDLNKFLEQLVLIWRTAALQGSDE